MFDESDELILKQLKVNEPEAFKTLFNKYYKALCLQAFLLVKDEEAAEDLVQGLFMKLWQEKQYFEIKTSIKSYLTTAVRNACFNMLKQQKGRVMEETDSIIHLSDESSEQILENKEMLNHLYVGIDSLPEQCRKVFNLVVLEEKKYQEAADELGVTINTVKTQLKRGFAKLREQMQKFR